MTVSVIGCGNMGASIALALDRKGYSLCLYDIDGKKAAGLGLPVAKDLDEALERADIVLLAVKPQVIPSLYDTLSEHNDKSYISILAGVPLEVLEYKLDADNIARFMPNIAARALKAVTAIAFSQAADEDFRKRAYDIAESFGSASSGVSLSYKLLAMGNLAKTFDRKIEKSLRKRYKLFCFLPANGVSPDAWREVKIQTARNLPKNLLEEAQIAATLEGMVSQETQLSVLSLVPDPAEELERMEREEQSRMGAVDRLTYGGLTGDQP